MAKPNNYRFIVGDVTQSVDRAAALALALQEFGSLDAMVNNAGNGAIGRFEEANEARLRQVMEVNFFAPAELIRSALPLLKKGQRPIVVNISSVLGHRAVPGKSEYSASKFALHGLSDALRLEFAPLGIDVLLVSPSTTATEFFNVAERSGNKKRPNELRGAMSAAVVARKIIAAMAAGRREIILSGGGKLLVWVDRLCPPLADWLISRWG